MVDNMALALAHLMLGIILFRVLKIEEAAKKMHRQGSLSRSRKKTFRREAETR